MKRLFIIMAALLALRLCAAAQSGLEISRLFGEIGRAHV